MSKYCQCKESVYCGFNPITCLACGKPNRERLKQNIKIIKKKESNKETEKVAQAMKDTRYKILNRDIAWDEMVGLLNKWSIALCSTQEKT